MNYYPEGTGKYPRSCFSTLTQIGEAVKKQQIFEGKVFLCDSQHNLHIDLGCCEGIIPRQEGALGILEGTLRDIALISKVGKCVCFRIMGFSRQKDKIVPILSRRIVQYEAKKNFVDLLCCGDIINARVTKLDCFGAFIDIGAGLNSLIPIDMLSVSRINHPSERLFEGQEIKAVLRKKEPQKLTFSLRELLGSWEENAAKFSAGETVTGIVRSLLPYGAFVELSPNLSGLTEPNGTVREGQLVSVYIKSLSPQKMKIKLTIVEGFELLQIPPKLQYYENGNHIAFWRYSPPEAEKQIFTEF